MEGLASATDFRMTVVVISHNYAEYLGEAIDSALAQTLPVDVLVVDDGSTDDSRRVIESYGERVRVLYKENGGNSSAVNAAFPLTRGEAVLFLDADDYLHPDAAEAVAGAWRAGCAKVQFRLALVDGLGQRRGVDPPADVPMPTGDVVPQLLRTGRYVTPVMTGNAFRRSVLERMLPIPEDDFRNTNDGYLNLICAFHGQVVSLDRELGSYRLHGRNLWAYSGEVGRRGLRQRVEYDLVRQKYLAAAARERGSDPVPDQPLDDPLHALQRLLLLRLGDPALPGDALRTMVGRGLRSAWRPVTPLDSAQRVALLVVLPLVAVLPQSLALRLARVVLASKPRPAWLRALARAARGLARSPRPAGTADRPAGQ